MNLYTESVPAFSKGLKNIDKWIEKALAHADVKKFDPEIYVVARLAPDQFEFRRQIQSACDVAKFAVAKLSGTPPPVHPDTEQTIAELRARIKTCRDYLATISPEAFAGAEDRLCSHTWMGGRSMKSEEYLREYALPNFYFHVVTTYSILRHNGVELGKRDYLGGLTLVSGT
ncbi:MAG: DUF1993 domain-containing protein [Deltaproteobacteria bacterium]|nr:DUF1993 domain-containing protein [Deltaproteobacteria bacterium]